MPRGLDIMIAFISSTALIFNLSTYILPINTNRAFNSIITIIYEGAPSLDFPFNGKCFADDVRVSCLDSMLEVARVGSTGYEDVDSFKVGHRYYNFMKLLIAAYSICLSPHLLGLFKELIQ
jgi:hypothetical protein